MSDREQDETIESLQRRVSELEDFVARVEANAADTVAMAEQLAVAKHVADTALRRAEDSEAHTRSVLNAIVDGVLSIRADGTIESANVSTARILRISEDELAGVNISEILHGFEGPDINTTMQRFCDAGRDARSSVTLQCIAQRGDGNSFPVELSISQLATAEQSRFTCVLRDVTERKNKEKEIQNLALYDQLTGLANRHEFQQRLNAAISMAGRQRSTAALLLVDLDKFKDVNDTHGHPVGDALLVSTARILKESTRDVDTVGRLGGDEFAIVLANVADPLRIRQVAERIVAKLSEPKVLDGSLISTGASIGISIFPRDATDAKELIRLGDRALYEAKRRGRNTYQFYDEVMDAKARAEKVLENELRLALVRNEFELHYQPQIDIGGDRLIGAEALVRWRHPTRGLLYPGAFIPIAESSGLIVDIGKRVLAQACHEVRRWHEADEGTFPVSVNVSPRQFLHSGFLQTVADALEDSKIDPRWLEFEITENVLIDDPEMVFSRLDKIRGLGISIAIDDFGTGYASLAYLRHFPVQKLKIDRTFIENLAISAPDRAIAEAIANLCDRLNISSVAEGIESTNQVQALRRTPCTGMQGFYLCPPLPSEEFRSWLRARQIRP